MKCLFIFSVMIYGSLKIIIIIIIADKDFFERIFFRQKIENIFFKDIKRSPFLAIAYNRTLIKRN